MFIMSKYVQLFKGEKYIFFLYQMGREGKGGLIGGIRPSMAVIFMLLWKKVVCLSSTLNILK